MRRSTHLLLAFLLLAAAAGLASAAGGQSSGAAAGGGGATSCSELSDAAASCSTDATNASNIGSGTLSLSRIPTLTDAKIPNDITIDLATQCTTALAGDSATDFFPAGTMNTARLGSGTANSSTFLRGDQTWATPSGGSPGGSDTQVQFNDGGSFGGDSGFTYDKTTDAPTVAGFTLSDSTTFAGGAHGWRLTRGGTALSNLSFMEMRRLIFSDGSNHLCLDLAGSGVLTVWDYLCTTRGDAWLRDMYLYGGSNRELALSSQVNRISMASDWKVAWNNSTTEGYDGSDEAAIEMQTVGLLKLSDAVRLNPRSAPPVTCGDSNTAGAMYTDTSLALCYCDGTSWQVLNPLTAGVGGCS